jgi:hypothetical protein
MSNHLAIAAVTLTLRDLIDEQAVTTFAGAPVDLQLTNQLRIASTAPHRVREVFPTENVINLFLYRTDINAALRNALAQNARPGEAGFPPVAINLEYLISIYPEGDREVIAHYFLGQVMRILHDAPVLTRERIQNALAQADLHRQVESVTVTPKPLSIEEMSKLWSIFQSQYRISVTYLITVVLIDSLRATRSALPVLTRGEDDRGVFTEVGPPPVLVEAKPASRMPSVQLGGALVVRGQNFGAGMTALLRHPALDDPISVPTTVTSVTELTVTIPAVGDEADVPANWPSGLWRLALAVDRPGLPRWTTNEVPFALAPSIKITPPLTRGAGTFELELSTLPQVLGDQDALLVFGAQQIAVKHLTPAPDTESATTLTFDVTAEVGLHRVRLRVDGVDSIPFVRTPAGVLEFDAAQTVEVV